MFNEGGLGKKLPWLGRFNIALLEGAYSATRGWSRPEYTDFLNFVAAIDLNLHLRGKTREDVGVAEDINKLLIYNQYNMFYNIKVNKQNFN